MCPALPPDLDLPAAREKVISKLPVFHLKGYMAWTLDPIARDETNPASQTQVQTMEQTPVPLGQGQSRTVLTDK